MGFKKVVMFIVSILLISFVNGFAGNNQDLVYFIDGFYTSAEDVDQTISQNNTGANNSCGPTSVMFIDNFYFYENGMCPLYTTTTSLAIDELEDIYTYLGLSYNTYTSLDELKNLAKYEYGYDDTKRANSSNSTDTNVDNMIERLKDDNPVLIVLDSNYSNNPVYGYNHIVIIYAYQRRPDDYGHTAGDKLYSSTFT